MRRDLLKHLTAITTKYFLNLYIRKYGLYLILYTIIYDLCPISLLSNLDFIEMINPRKLQTLLCYHASNHNIRCQITANYQLQVITDITATPVRAATLPEESDLLVLAKQLISASDQLTSCQIADNHRAIPPIGT